MITCTLDPRSTSTVPNLLSGSCTPSKSGSTTTSHDHLPFPFPYPCSRRCPCPLRLRPLLLSLELLLQQFPYCCCTSCFRCHYYPTTNATIAITTATATSIATTTAATATTATTATMTFYYPVSCDHNGDHWYYFTKPAYAPVTTDASTADAAPLPQLLLLL